MLLKSSSEIILWCLNMLLKESVDTNIMDKRKGKAVGLHTLETQKVHPTGEFVIVA